jgi:hypothetical protein
MADTYIDYDSKVQDALRGVVRSVLTDTEKNGLNGDHHFYVAFKTQADGVNIPDHLVSRFPDEMTIVLQHKYWGLKVYEKHFEIGLSFNQKPEHLTIPFAAITGFVDPSVQFALQFHDETDAANDKTSSAPNGPVADTSNALSSSEFVKSNTDKVEEDTAEQKEVAEATGGDNVVTLDTFRKK